MCTPYFMRQLFHSFVHPKNDSLVIDASFSKKNLFWVFKFCNFLDDPVKKIPVQYYVFDNSRCYVRYHKNFAIKVSLSIMFCVINNQYGIIVNT